MAEHGVTCPYCSALAKLVDGRTVYPHRDDLAIKMFWRCGPCDAWVGCHPGTTVPLGRLANAELRAAKQAAHAAFDPLWKAKARIENIPKGQARGAGYAWLAAQLGIDRAKCHIGEFDVETCKRVLDVIAASKRKAPATNQVSA